MVETRVILLLLAFASVGCKSISLPKPVRNDSSSQSTKVLLDYAPQALEYPWTSSGVVILNDSPESVYESIIDPLLVDCDSPPEGVAVIVDHSKSTNGANQWGPGSVARTENNGLEVTVKIVHAVRPQLVITEITQKRNEFESHAINVTKLMRTESGETRLAMECYGNPVESSFLDWGRGSAFKKTAQLHSQILAEEFGGRVLAPDSTAW